jgi:hypothetical protein
MEYNMALRDTLLTHVNDFTKTGKFCRIHGKFFIVYDERTQRTWSIPEHRVKIASFEQSAYYHEAIDDGGGLDEQTIARRAAEVRATWSPGEELKRNGNRQISRPSRDRKTMSARRDRVLRRMRTRHQERKRLL